MDSDLWFLMNRTIPAALPVLVQKTDDRQLAFPTSTAGGFHTGRPGVKPLPESTKMLHRLYSGEVRFEKLSVELLRKGACRGKALVPYMLGNLRTKCE